MKDQAIKRSRSRKRKVWVIRLIDGSEYSAFVSDKQDAIAYARMRNLKIDKVYLEKRERWNNQ